MNFIGKAVSVSCSYLRYRIQQSKVGPVHQSSWQSEQVKRHLEWVWAHSPYYQSCVDAKDKCNLEAYPVINKATMMKHFDEMNTVGLSKDVVMNYAIQAERLGSSEGLFEGEYTVGLSTGTSGNRGLFVATEKERLEWVSCLLARVFPQPIFNYNRVALFLRTNSSLYEESASSGIKFKYFSLSSNFDHQLSSLVAFCPHVLIAPGSILAEIARFPEIVNQLKVKKVIAVAEVLPDQLADQLEGIFGQKIHQIYQATEGFLAHSCRDGYLHLNEDIQHVEREWVDEKQGLFNPIITDFRRRTQPIIRYRLDDVLELAQINCSCSSPFTKLKSIAGRLNDTVWWRSVDSNERALVHPDLLCRIMIHASDTHEYRIVQRAGGMEIQVNEISESQVRDALHALANQLRAKLPPITFAAYRPPQPGMKVRHVVCEDS